MGVDKRKTRTNEQKPDDEKTTNKRRKTDTVHQSQPSGPITRSRSIQESSSSSSSGSSSSSNLQINIVVLIENIIKALQLTQQVPVQKQTRLPDGIDLFADTFDCGGDGDCLFKSIAHFTRENNPEVLRRTAANYINENQAKFKQCINPNAFEVLITENKTEVVTNPTKYAELMALSGTYGGQIEISILASILARPIVVLSRGYRPQIHYPAVDAQPESAEPIFLRYESESMHYKVQLLQESTASLDTLKQLEELAEQEYYDISPSSSNSSSSSGSSNSPGEKLKRSPISILPSNRISRREDREKIKSVLTSPEKVLENVLNLDTKDVADLIEDEDNKEELAEISSSSSHAEHIPQQQKGRGLLLANLDRLAWLLQDNTRSCSSVCLINKKLLLSDNHIHQRSTGKSNTFEHKTGILDYFTLVAQEDADKLKEERPNFIKKILETKFKGENMGSLKPIGEESRNKIINTLLQSVEKHFDKDISTERMRQNMISECEKILREALYAETQHYATVGLYIKTICRLRRVERFLKNDEPSSQRLKEALVGTNGKAKPEKHKTIQYSTGNVPKTGDTKWLHHSTRHGCAILAIGVDDVHAEARIIDFLVASRAITSSDILGEDAYIGISKKCCKDCDLVVRAVNEVLCEQDPLIQNFLRVSGSHNRAFKYEKPFFLKEKRQSRKGTQERPATLSGRDAQLSENIRGKFEELKEDQNHSSYIVDSRMSPNTDELHSSSPSGMLSSLDLSSISPLANTPPNPQSTPSEPHLSSFPQGMFSTNSVLSGSSKPTTPENEIKAVRKNLKDLHIFLQSYGKTTDGTTLNAISEQIDEIKALLVTLNTQPSGTSPT